MQRWLDDLRIPSVTVSTANTPWPQVLEALREQQQNGRTASMVATVADGFFACWNASNPAARVKKGDIVVAADGAPWSQDMMLQQPVEGAGPQTTTLDRQCPNAQQLEVVRRVATRVMREGLEERDGTAATTVEEPLFHLIHGLPGTGKSRVIAWIRELFEAVLGWQHGVQFVCLAFQNAMAANIDGHTVHHWAGIPGMDNMEEKRSKPADIDDLFIRCQSLRWIRDQHGLRRAVR